MADDNEQFAQYKPLTDWNPNQSVSEVPAELPVDEPKGEPDASVPPVDKDIVDKLTKPGINPTGIIIAVGAGAGILFGLAIAANSIHPAKTDPIPMGAVTANAVGLTGHLFTKWDDKPEYRLNLEPVDADQRAGFSLVVGDPPRPLSINVQLKDSLGFVLCNKDVLLKYDPAKAAAHGGKGAARQAQSDDLAKQQSQELEREKGADTFENGVGPDGQIDSISAQGELPCSKKALDSMVSWGFIPNFPTLAEQSELLRHQPGEKSIEENAASAAHRRESRKPAPVTPLFLIEGDDEIVWSDASGANVETSGNKSFTLDMSGQGTGSAWRVYPAKIHYRCDQTSTCILTRPDSVIAMRARMKH
jgi:hypothetical protein